MNYKLFILAAIALIVASCATTDDGFPQQLGQPQTVTVSVPDNAAKTKAYIWPEPNTKNIDVFWKPEGETLDLYFKQGDAIVKVPEVAISVSDDRKNGKFVIPAEVIGINLADNYTLYGVHGTNGKVEAGKILVDVNQRFAGEFGSIGGEYIKTFDMPMFFKAEVNAGVPLTAVTFEHLGTLQVVHIKNTHSELQVIECHAIPTEEGVGFMYYSEDNSKIPHYDLINGDIHLSQGASYSFFNVVNISNYQEKAAVTWGRPNGNIPPEIRLKMDFHFIWNPIYSENTLPARSEPLEVGKAYHLYAQAEVDADGVYKCSFRGVPDVEPISIIIKNKQFYTRLGEVNDIGLSVLPENADRFKINWRVNNYDPGYLNELRANDWGVFSNWVAKDHIYRFGHNLEYTLTGKLPNGAEASATFWRRDFLRGLWTDPSPEELDEVISNAGYITWKRGHKKLQIDFYYSANKQQYDAEVNKYRVQDTQTLVPTSEYKITSNAPDFIEVTDHGSHYTLTRKKFDADTEVTITYEFGSGVNKSIYKNYITLKKETPTPPSKELPDMPGVVIPL